MAAAEDPIAVAIVDGGVAVGYAPFRQTVVGGVYGGVLALAVGGRGGEQNDYCRQDIYFFHFFKFCSEAACIIFCRPRKVSNLFLF